MWVICTNNTPQGVASNTLTSATDQSFSVRVNFTSPGTYYMRPCLTVGDSFIPLPLSTMTVTVTKTYTAPSISISSYEIIGKRAKVSIKFSAGSNSVTFQNINVTIKYPNGQSGQTAEDSTSIANFSLSANTTSTKSASILCSWMGYSGGWRCTVTCTVNGKTYTAQDVAYPN